ncbi:putative S-adenosyl-L-methionine-dependent methyltransferase TehB [Polystyrenella longa]|uniref:Putative S-adenosyl-L-methionine-dependent methyltransferase TehB n=1 Tax=Polystyrenella longa TaxID=2528007 RepID=A0A518CK59_9PLAN|nr:class I SAM-dependent methyltransferase [Polystyrenella longa]QDU79613.1 putative S-adenosyl-L-methionine-dependent methyltransferase TehB [Polystyrenella longa]
MSEFAIRWNERYQNNDTPWDSRLVSKELIRVLKDHSIEPGRALELGCGTGTNAIYLAEQGFAVTAVDISERAIDTAAMKANEANVDIRFVLSDITDLQMVVSPFDFVFDRGCYHCVRKEKLSGFLNTLKKCTRPGSLWLTLSGNSHESDDEHIPKVSEEELKAELGDLFEFVQLREFHFEDEGERQGPLGWSALLKRKGERAD